MNVSKSAVFFVVLSLVVLAIVVLFPKNVETNLEASDFLRIHIRANSNDASDQNIKYKIKDEIVKVVAPLLADAVTKQQAVNIINSNINLITTTADKILSENGFLYKSKACIRSEFFPTRTYDDLTLESDVYDAIIIELGTGNGDNWWCVAYPPMCFVQVDGSGGENLVYKSKLAEIIKNFFNC